MLLRSMFAQNERSLRLIRMDLSGINRFIGDTAREKARSGARSMAGASFMD